MLQHIFFSDHESSARVLKVFAAVLEALCLLFLGCSEADHLLAIASDSLQYTAGWSAMCSRTLSSYLAVPLLMPILASLLRLSLPDALILKAGAGHHPSGNIA